MPRSQCVRNQTTPHSQSGQNNSTTVYSTITDYCNCKCNCVVYTVTLTVVSNCNWLRTGEGKTISRVASMVCLPLFVTYNMALCSPGCSYTVNTRRLAIRKHRCQVTPGCLSSEIPRNSSRADVPRIGLPVTNHPSFAIAIWLLGIWREGASIRGQRWICTRPLFSCGNHSETLSPMVTDTFH